MTTEAERLIAGLHRLLYPPKPRPLRIRRLEAGLTQRELAALAGIDPRTVSKLEHGEELPQAAADVDEALRLLAERRQHG